jgi:hypothetical protein
MLSSHVLSQGETAKHSCLAYISPAASALQLPGSLLYLIKAFAPAVSPRNPIRLLHSVHVLLYQLASET